MAIISASAGPYVSHSCDSLSTNVQSEHITLRFRHNRSELDTLYAENASSYARLRTLLAFGGVVDIEIHGAASPVGREGYNAEIALRRAKATRDIINALNPREPIPITIESVGEDWESFTKHIEANYHRHNRDAVLKILHSNYSNNEKKRRLRALDYDHTTWRCLVHRHMASSRNAVSIVVRTIHFEDEILPLPELPIWEVTSISHEDLDTPYIPTPIEQAEQTSATSEDIDRKIVLAARTNLLVPALNIGLEVPIGNRWSVGAEYYYPWIWPAPDNRNCFELLAWNLEGRYWLGKERTTAQRLQGHALGLYAGGGYYDVERNFKGHQGEFVDVGIDYTYAMPVAKGKLHFEFSVGLGYIYSQARPYEAAEKGGELLWGKQLQKVHYFGPTRLNVALTVPIFKRIKREGRNE